MFWAENFDKYYGKFKENLELFCVPCNRMFVQSVKCMKLQMCQCTQRTTVKTLNLLLAAYFHYINNRSFSVSGRFEFCLILFFWFIFRKYFSRNLILKLYFFFLSSRYAMEDYKFLFKVVLIGNAGVGEFWQLFNWKENMYQVNYNEIVLNFQVKRV